jgi:betaine reductase
VVLGNGEANGVEVFAETVTQGDPTYAGPLAGVALKIPVYHVLEREVRCGAEKLRDEKLQLSALVIDVEPMRQALKLTRKALKRFKDQRSSSRLSGNTLNIEHGTLNSFGFTLGTAL